MDDACAGWCSCCQNSETNSSLKKFWNSCTIFCLEKCWCHLSVCVCVCVCERERERERERVFQRCHDVVAGMVWGSCELGGMMECHMWHSVLFNRMLLSLTGRKGFCCGWSLSFSIRCFCFFCFSFVSCCEMGFVCSFSFFFWDGYYFPLALSIWSSPLHARFAAHKRKLRAQESLRERMNVQVSASQSDRCIVVPCTYLMAPCFHPWSYHCTASKECLVPLHDTKSRVHHHPW
jgi:hypothetical protein